MNEGLSPDRLADLATEFPREEVHWRAQSVSERDGKHKALALAYIDARNVMERLDTVCGPENWQDRLEETPKGRVFCGISINVGGEWITKWDGAGATDVEGDKGAISDASKRSAVKWGIGRYLYALPNNIWVPCEVGSNGKFRKFTEDPWSYVKPHQKPKADPIPPKRSNVALPATIQDLLDDVRVRDTQAALRELWVNKGETASKGEHGSIIKDAFNKRKAAIELMDGVN